MKRVLLGLSLPIFLLGFLVGCDSRALPPWVIGITADDLSPRVDNRLFGLPARASWTYQAQSDAGLHVISVGVLAEPREVWGTRATVVRNTVLREGELLGASWHWYAQDTEGTVWKLGQKSCEYLGYACVGGASDWEAGLDGALPGIAMKADPQLGDTYFQEYYPGRAQDEDEVVELNAAVDVPAGNFRRCIKTRHTTELVPELVEYRSYCPGVGLAFEEEEQAHIELVAYSHED